MKISVFGNPDIKEDSLVVEMVPELKAKFPQVDIKVEDPSEGLVPPEKGEWVILDVARGVDKVRMFEDIDKLVTEKRVSLHDYDVSMELKLLKRLGKVKKIKIVAVPEGMEKEKAFREVTEILKGYCQEASP